MVRCRSDAWRSSGLRELVVQPSFGDAPFPLHCSFRDPKVRADLVLAESSEEPHFHHFCLTLVEGLQASERLVKDHYIDGGLWCCGQFAHLNTDLIPVKPTLSSVLGSRVIDKNLTHGVSGHGKKVRSALPIDRMDLAEPEVGFMDQSRRLERMVGALVAHMTPSNPSQITI